MYILGISKNKAEVRALTYSYPLSKVPTAKVPRIRLTIWLGEGSSKLNAWDTRKLGIPTPASGWEGSEVRVVSGGSQQWVKGWKQSYVGEWAWMRG